ncbi:FBXO31 [Bugula neritina]|uniref:FBXO31 n=1 Tax=Bugula neritina TaxID=10212 RepID=A0A7J7K9U5_BUGNE|nr:FBXO31 [Bugula neritina]
MDILPQEIWLKVLSYLDGESLKSVESACYTFSNWLKDELFWFNKCKAALHEVSAYPKLELKRNKTKTPWRDLYINLICPYKYLLGYWQKFTSSENEYTGQLLRFFILVDLGLIYGQISRASEDGYKFETRINIHSDGEFSSYSSVERYPFGITKHELLSLPVDTVCEQRPLDDHSEYMKHVYSQEVIEFEGLATDSEEEVSRWVKFRSFSQWDVDGVAPAVYKSIYGPHGEELVLLHGVPNERKLIGTKILGDRNVPFGKHSFVIDLDRPLVLNSSQQDSCETLVAVHAGEETAQKTSSQPFCVPSGASYADQNILKFNTCIERYAGRGTLAYDDYTDPWWCDTHFIRFDEDNFAVHFFYGHYLGFYTRHRDIVF